MLKSLVIASAIVVSVPALAQTGTGQETTAPDAQSTSPESPTSGSVPTRDADQGAPQASAAQVAELVEQEFPAYDGDKDGEITQEEFGKWMVALRSATDPNTDAKSAEVQTWVGQAFASADADKSTRVSKVELTAFLSQGAS